MCCLNCRPFPYSDLLAVVADGKEFAAGIADQPKSSTKYSLPCRGRGKTGEIQQEEESSFDGQKVCLE